MNRSRYTDNCLDVFQTKGFTKLRHDPTKSIESKIQRESRKLKTRLSVQEYLQFHTTDSIPCKC